MKENVSIIIVEDEAIVALESKMKLISAGYSVLAVVSSAEDAVNKTRENNPDLVLMDIKLKGTISGIEAAMQIRENSEVPILFVTGNSDSRTRALVNDVPYSSILHKPILSSDLITEIEKMLELS